MLAIGAYQTKSVWFVMFPFAPVLYVVSVTDFDPYSKPDIILELAKISPLGPESLVANTVSFVVLKFTDEAQLRTFEVSEPFSLPVKELSNVGVVAF